MHRSHLRMCGVGLVLALGYLVLTGGSAGGFGLLVAALVCPLAMILAMSVLMRPDADPRPDPVDDVAEPVDRR